MGRIRNVLSRITSVSTPLGGISWSSPTGAEADKTPSSGPRDHATSRFSDGDWITAAIVAQDRAAAILQGVAIAIKVRKNANWQSRVEVVDSAVGVELSRLRQRYEAGGETDEDRCEACIARTTADIIDREMTSYRWKVDEKHDADPLVMFRETVHGLKKNETD